MVYHLSHGPILTKGPGHGTLLYAPKGEEREYSTDSTSDHHISFHVMPSSGSLSPLTHPPVSCFCRQLGGGVAYRWLGSWLRKAESYSMYCYTHVHMHMNDTYYSKAKFKTSCRDRKTWVCRFTIQLNTGHTWIQPPLYIIVIRKMYEKQCGRG